MINSLWHSYVLDCGLILFPITKVASIDNSQMSPFVCVAEGSRGQPLGVTWEHGSLTNIVKAQVQHADSLQAWVAKHSFLLKKLLHLNTDYGESTGGHLCSVIDFAHQFLHRHEGALQT